MTPQHEPPQTQAEVYVQDWFGTPLPPGVAGPPSPFPLGTSLPGGAAGPPSPLKREFVNTIGFTYSNDVLNLGDPFSFTVPSPEGRYRDHFQRGSRVWLYLTNPAVNGGRRTLKHTGIVVSRVLRADEQGCFLDIQCADLGWHLSNNDAPLWFVLDGGQLLTLLQNRKWIDPSWGINTSIIATDSAVTSLIRQGQLGLNNGRAQLALDMQALGTTVHIQVEPGDRIADILLTYARRKNLLFTVTPDGYMQLWRPTYTAKPLYSINLHNFGERSRSLNNVISCQVSEDISQIYTQVTCIGESTGQLAPNNTNQNAQKRRGSFVNDKVLPFVHRMNFCDGDIYNGTDAKAQAQWRYARGLFDSWAAVYHLRGHHQNGVWLEADQMVTVHDTLNGIEGDFYCSAVSYSRDAEGDRTQVTLRLPNLLQASYGVYKRPPRYTAPKAIPSATQEGVWTTTTTDAK